VGPYRGLESPAVVVAGSPNGSEAARGNNIGSLFHRVSLEPGAEARIVYVLGITDTPDASARSLGDTVTQPRWARPRGSPSDWEAYFGAFSVQTRMLTPLPCSTVGTHCMPHLLHWSRFVSGTRPALGEGSAPGHSPGHLGSGTRCPGRSRIPHGAAVGVQFEDGTAGTSSSSHRQRWPSLAAERPAWPQWFCDDHLWLVIATCAYLKETGDDAYLVGGFPTHKRRRPARSTRARRQRTGPRCSG